MGIVDEKASDEPDLVGMCSSMRGVVTSFDGGILSGVLEGLSIWQLLGEN